VIFSDSENEVDIVEETLNVGCVTNKEFLKLTTSTCNYEDKENLGYENFDNTTNVAASSLILFHYSGKECRPQEPCEFPECANILSSTSVYINQEFSKPANSICIQEDKKNPGYEHFDNSNVTASLLLKLFHCSASGKVGRLQEPCEFPDSANILSSTSVYINEEFSKPTISMCNQEDKENAGYENFDNANVAASLRMLFRCSSKES
jgi:hypothetical protein